MWKQNQTQLFHHATVQHKAIIVWQSPSSFAYRTADARGTLPGATAQGELVNVCVYVCVCVCAWVVAG